MVTGTPMGGGQLRSATVENDYKEGFDIQGRIDNDAYAVAETLIDFVPIAGGLKDIYQGYQNGNGWQMAMGAGIIGLDILTLGSSSLAKGTAKTVGKEIVEQSAKELAEVTIKSGGSLSTRFVSTSKGLADLQPTLNRIASGGKFPHRNDGSVFKNLEGLLPKQDAGFYREFVHPIPGISGPGPMRIVTGQNGGMWFTADHYATFIPIR